MAARIFQYGLRAPADWAEDMDAHFRLQWRTYNDLIALYRRARDDEKAFVRKQDLKLDELESRRDKLYEDRREARSKDDQQKFAVLTKEIQRLYQEEIKPLRKTIYISGKFKAWKKDRQNQIREEIKDLYNEKDEEGLSRAQRLHWGTFNQLAKRAKQADAATYATPHIPRFRHFAEMPLGIYQQIQKGTSYDGEGLTAAELESGRHSQVAMLPGASEQFRSLKIKAFGDRYLHFPIVFHRPLPEGARIKEVHVVRTRVARKARWKVNFVLSDLPEPASDTANKYAIGIDIGWYREDDDRRRVLIPESTNPQWTLPLQFADEMSEIEKSQEQVENLQALRDKNLDEIISVIKAKELQGAPDELLEKWNSVKISRRPAAAKVAAMILLWRRQYCGVDPDLLALLEGWRKQDARLYEPLSHRRDKALARRKDLYRNIARSIVDNHGAIAIEKFDLAKAAEIKHPTTGAHNRLGAQARAGRVRVGLSEFREILKWMAKDAGVKLIEVTGRTTQTCSECGKINKLEDPRSREYVCQGCGVVVDRDKNAARNLLRVACERSGDDDDAPLEKQRVSKRGWGWKKDRSQSAGKSVTLQPVKRRP